MLYIYMRNVSKQLFWGSRDPILKHSENVNLKCAEKRIGAHLALKLHNGSMCQRQRLHPQELVLLSHETINRLFALVVPVIDVLVIQPGLPKGTCYNITHIP